MALLAVAVMTALGALLLPGTASAAGTPTTAVGVPSQGSATDTAAAQSFGGCLKGQRAGDLLLLIDTSSSLKSSDAQNARVTAAKYLLQQMATQSERAGVQLDVQIAGFATVFDPRPTPWTTLGGSTVGDMTRAVDGFAGQVGGGDTDYWTALEGARRSLADHAKATGPASDVAGPRCQAIAWFTDGQLDIEPRDGSDPARATALPYAPGVDLRTRAGADAATAAATTSLCRPGGLADSLRSAHVVMFAVGLTSPGAPAGSFDLMKSVATGAPFRGGPCGAITNPSPGSFALASDLDGLLKTFDDILGPADIATPAEAVCAEADTTCRGHEFVLDESVDGVHILGQATGVPGVVAELTGPDGVRHPLTTKAAGAAQPLSFGSVTGTYTWETDASVVIDLSDSANAAAGWTGLWALRFVDPAATASGKTSSTSIHLWGNVVPTWLNRTATAPSGTPLTGVRLGLAKSGGASVDPGALRGTAALSATLLRPGAAPVEVATGLTKETIGDPVSIDLTSVAPGQTTLQLTLVLTTAPTTRPGTGEPVPGTRLSPQEVDLPLKVESPVGYPTVSSTVDFGTTEEAGGQTAQLDVTGPGCVWVAAGAPLSLSSTPDGVARVGVTADGATTPQTCVAVAQGQHAAITLHMTSDAAGSGTASGTLPVTIAPTGQLDKAKVVDVAFTGDFRKPVNVTNFLAALLAALLLGPGIPLALLYLLKWWGARIPENGLYAQRIPVDVVGPQVLRGGARFTLTDRDLTQVVAISGSGARSLHVQGVDLRTRVGWSPFGTGYTAVEPGRGLACATSTDPVPHGKGLTGRLPLAVHNQWAVIHDPAGDPGAADVLVLVSTAMTPDQRRAFADKIAEELPGVLDRVREAAGATGSPAGPGGSGGPGAGPNGAPADGVRYGPAGGSGYGQQYGPGYGAAQGQGYGSGYGPAPVGGYQGAPQHYGPTPDAGTTPTYGPSASSSSSASYGPPPWVPTEPGPTPASSTVPNAVPGRPSTAYERFYGPPTAPAPTGPDRDEEPPTDGMRRGEAPPEWPPYGRRP